MENLRWCSSSSKSETLVPSSTLPRRSTAPALKSIASASVVLPAARCPTRARLRMSATVCLDMLSLHRCLSACRRGANGSSRHGFDAGCLDGGGEIDSAFVEGPADDAAVELQFR